MSLSKHALERLRKEQRRIQGDLKRITVLDGSPGEKQASMVGISRSSLVAQATGGTSKS